MILKTRAKFPGIIICLVALLLVSCMGGYGPPYDNSSFVSADTALDGRIGIFTMKRLVYRPASGWRAFPDGGIPKYLMDRNYIAVYDFTSGRTRVIYREDALREGFWLPGSSTLHIAATFGSRVIVRTSGQVKADYRFHKRLSWLDLDAGKLTPLPLDEELAAQGRVPEVMYLVDGSGTLVLTVSQPREAGKPDRSSKGQGMELWVRHPDGSYDAIGPFVHYYGVKDDEIHYWTPDNRYLAFHLKTKTRREANRSGYGGVHSDPKAGLDLKRHLSILYRDRYYLSLGHRENGSWQYEQLPLTVREVAGE